MAEKRTVIITGASGLLGRAMYKAFSDNGWTVLGLAFTRAKDHLIKLDLTDRPAVLQFVLDHKPKVIVHCAAQRFPDKVEKDIEAAELLNIEATEFLAECAAIVEAKVVYISTDYVFNGRQPPYSEDSHPIPANNYGRTKLLGEDAVYRKKAPGNMVLRVPVLYGPVEYAGESAVSALIDPILNEAKTTQISDYEIRRPTHVKDIAQICVRLVNKSYEDPGIQGTYHISAQESFTKYKMALAIAKALNRKTDHLSGDPFPVGDVLRPHDSTMTCERLEKALGSVTYTSFAEGVKDVLSSLGLSPA